DINLRSIQRDLNKLSQVLPLVGDEHKPQGWSWQADAAVFDVPGLDPQTALAFTLVEGYLTPLLPKSSLQYLKPYFHTSHGVLDAQGNGLSRWADKVRVLPKGQPLLPPKIDPDVQSVIYQALLEERRAKVTYHRQKGNEIKEYEISPVALVLRDQTVYIVCTMWEYTEVRQLVLHRMKSAELLDTPASKPEGFDLDEYIRAGEFGMPVGGGVLLEMKLSPRAARWLEETPLNYNQTWSLGEDGYRKVSVLVERTEELMAWLRGLGENLICADIDGVKFE
ncbi:MAG: WYL domain-containing protein, partial [Halothiobacillaceae bacterium]|nr:WYL domain-containing protein [Halothiobacillaceae bacterium]